MKSGLWRFLSMIFTAEILIFVGLGEEAITPKMMILITGAACGLVNLLLGGDNRHG